MIFKEKPKAATAGSNILSISVPLGAIMKHIAARNETKPWRNISLELSEDGTRDNRFYSLTGRRSQPGSNRDVVWKGNIRIDSPFRFVLATISDCDLADVLWLVVGYEMPERKRKWGK